MASGSGYVRPGFLMARIVNPVVRRFGLAPALIVRGRRSGERIVVPMGEPLELGGARYLVSGRGETHWVRNLRAAGRAEFRWHGSTEPFDAVEILGPQRDEIVRTYRARLGRGVDRYFREIPDSADHPVFRMDQAATAEH